MRKDVDAMVMTIVLVMMVVVRVAKFPSCGRAGSLKACRFREMTRRGDVQSRCFA